MVAGINLEATCKRLDDIRKEKGLTVRDIQHYFGFSTPQAVYKWMSGQALPCLDNLVILADLYRCKVDDMIIRGFSMFITSLFLITVYEGKASYVKRPPVYINTQTGEYYQYVQIPI